MKYKAIIFDLDGTALPSRLDGLPSKRVINAVNKAKLKFHVSCASGRSLEMCQGVFELLKLQDPCVLNGGSQIINPKSGEILWQQSIPPELVQEIIKVPKDYQLTFWINNTIIDHPQAQINLTEPVNIIVLAGIKESDSQQLFSIFSKVPNLAVHILPSWTTNAFDIHITHQLATKKQAIKKLTSILGVKKSEVIGVGDGHNDLPLFESVGLKVAMGNAIDELKAVADVVTGSVEEDGLAKVIEKFLV